MFPSVGILSISSLVVNKLILCTDQLKGLIAERWVLRVLSLTHPFVGLYLVEWTSRLEVLLQLLILTIEAVQSPCHKSVTRRGPPGAFSKDLYWLKYSD